jgi:isopentenyl-diphosphate delta-isomerase
MSDQRKKDHIELTQKSRPDNQINLGKFHYEPLFSPHPTNETDISKKFIGNKFALPIWVSSMTGGTEKAKNINLNLAMACDEFGMGMGLGSCRSLLIDYSRFDDFNIKEFMGQAPLYTNFGIAQLEELITKNELSKIDKITQDLKADGIIIHVNPLQEWAQPEGDRFKRSPIDTIKTVVAASRCGIIVKEVGQGFGPKSLEALTQLPLKAIEFSGFGGTNFTILEQTRLSGSFSGKKGPKNSFGLVGHTSQEMIGWVNQLDPDKMKCREFIISGGVQDPLSGFILTNQLNHNSIFGMASKLLEFAMDDYEKLYVYLDEVRDSLRMANAFLRSE